MERISGTEISTVPDQKTTKSPFKDRATFEQEIRDFANAFKTTVLNHATRISDYFEMSCFNYVIQYYVKMGYIAQVKNLQGQKYRYKCSTSGIQSNFSHFEVSKSNSGTLAEFEIHHNLAVQSSHHSEIFTTPDICIIEKGKVRKTKKYYDTKRVFSYVKNINMVTFCEVKQFTPFPELLFNFTGVVNELKKDVTSGSLKPIHPIHLAPTLMISGKPNKQTARIKEVLEKRYCINICYNIFEEGVRIFKTNAPLLKSYGQQRRRSASTVLKRQ